METRLPDQTGDGCLIFDLFELYWKPYGIIIISLLFSARSPKFLVGTVSTDILIKADDACRDLVDEAKNYLLLPQERPLMQGNYVGIIVSHV